MIVGRRKQTRRERRAIAAALAVAIALGGCSLGGAKHASDSGALTPSTTRYVDLPRDKGAYQGLGAWVDLFDFVPENQPAGRDPVITPDDVDRMAGYGVRTLFLQASANDDKTPQPVVRPDLLGAFVERAHARGMRVVGWYLPTFTDVDADLMHINGVLDFRSPSGQRFDGLALDLEWTKGVTDPDERSRRLVDLSTRVRANVGPDTALGAIVLPPVLTEVISPKTWPGFPWTSLSGVYDVWLPMAYWTERTDKSGYRDASKYLGESVQRLRADLAQPAALVHAIGGIADGIDEDGARTFLKASADAGAIGWSLYDYRTTVQGVWAVLRGGISAATTTTTTVAPTAGTGAGVTAATSPPSSTAGR